MNINQVHMGKILVVWCVSIVFVIAIGIAQCGATEPVLGGSNTTATGAAGGATAEGASNQLERCAESLGTVAVVDGGFNVFAM